MTTAVKTTPRACSAQNATIATTTRAIMGERRSKLASELPRKLAAWRSPLPPNRKPRSCFLFLAPIETGEHGLDVMGKDVFRGALTIERDFRRQRTACPNSLKRDARRGQWTPERVVGRRRLVAAMGHAIGALLVSACAVAIPVRGLHELLEGAGVPLSEKVAGLLPAEDVPRRHAHGVQRNSWLPARKSRKSGECEKRHFLPLPMAKTLRNSSLVLRRARKRSWSGARS